MLSLASVRRFTFLTRWKLQLEYSVIFVTTAKMTVFALLLGIEPNNEADVSVCL